MIKLEGITKSFGSLQVLKGIDLEINKGEIVSIVGPSGAGKTTLLQIMGTLDEPDAGTVAIDGTVVSRMKEKELSAFRNKNIGFVFQFHQLLPEFTALENVMIPAFIAGVSSKEANERAMEILAFMGLTDRASHKPNELSGGEKQRVAVARALINHPAVILADEPSGSLDTHNKEDLHQLFFDLRDRLGQTFVIVTHDEGLAKITDRTVLSGVIGMHLFLYITTNTILVVTNIRRHSFEICGCEFLVKHQLFQVSYFPLLLPVLCNDLGLIIADVRMMHHSLYTCLIDVDPVNLSGIHGEPRTELFRF